MLSPETRHQNNPKIIVGVTCLTLVLLSACTPAGQPLQITNVSVSPEPVVGQIVTLDVEIMSTDDEKDVTFTLDTLESHGNKIHLVAGDPEWQGSLTANEPQSFQFSVCVLQEGSWPIRLRAISYLPDGNGWDAFETINLEGSLTSGRLIRSEDYTFSQEEQTRMPTPQPVSVSPECSGQHT